jgi:hypothetical protein
MTDSPVDAALEYAERGYRVFPARDKSTPLCKWRKQATTNIIQIVAWWGKWPRALIGTPTGETDVVLDADQPCGLDTLETFGWPFGCWFVTPTVHTPRGGLHAHLKIPPGNIRNTVGGKGRGIGVNLDWRGLGGYVLLPSPGSGYVWDPHLGSDTPLAEVPAELLPRDISRSEISSSRPIQTSGLDRYAEGALDSACRAILGAPNGEQERTLNDHSYSIGTLAGAGGIPEGFARDTLKWAAAKLVSYDTRRPWRSGEADAKAERAFDAGLRQPRGGRRYA